MSKEQDTEYTDIYITYITEAEGKAGEGWIVNMGKGLRFFIPNRGITPKVGSVIRVYGRGLGFPVRGVDIDGREVFYRPPEAVVGHG